MSRYWISLGPMEMECEENDEAMRHNKRIEKIAKGCNGAFIVAPNNSASFVTRHIKVAETFAEMARELFKELGREADGINIVMQPECPKCGSLGGFSETYCPDCGTLLETKY